MVSVQQFKLAMCRHLKTLLYIHIICLTYIHFDCDVHLTFLVFSAAAIANYSLPVLEN